MQLHKFSIRYTHPFLAWEYDQRNKLERDELEWYSKYAHRGNGSILELACGSGRLTIPLVEAGFTVDAVDNAKGMLDRLNLKLESATAGVKDRIKIICADMGEYMPTKRYSLIIVAYNSLQYLETIDCIRSLLHNVSTTIIPGGYFLVAVRNRDLTLLKEGQRNVTDWMNQPVVDEERGMSVGQKTTEYFDRRRNQLVKERTYEIRQNGKPPKVYTETTYAPAIEVKDYVDMLKEFKFSVKINGGYDEREFTPDSKLACLVCKGAV